MLLQAGQRPLPGLRCDRDQLEVCRAKRDDPVDDAPNRRDGHGRPKRAPYPAPTSSAAISRSDAAISTWSSSKTTSVIAHPETGIALEIEAGRGVLGNAIYRDLIQTSLLIDARYLVLAVLIEYHYGLAGRR